MNPDTLLALMLTHRFFYVLLTSKAFRLLWVDAMDWDGVPHRECASLDVAMGRITKPFRLVSLLYHPEGPCDSCNWRPDVDGVGNGPVVCWYFMARLCRRCRDAR